MARSRFEVLVIGGESGSADSLLRVLSSLARVPDIPILATLVEETRRLDPLIDALVRHRWDAAYARDGETPRGLRLCPAGHVMSIGRDTKLQVARAKGHPIDAFFVGAARQWRNAAAALLLSGSGKDGTAGFVALTACGGARLVQSPADAPAESILRNAILNDDPEQILLLHEIAPALDELLDRHTAA